MRLRLCLEICCVLVLVLSGCGGGDDGGPHRVPVAVTVTYKGAPVEGANVTFVPVGDAKAAFGVTDADGEVELSTQGENDGAMPGEYQVTVRKTENEGPKIEVDTESGEMPANAQRMAPTRTKNLLPKKYSAIGTTDLKATVADDSNEFTFDLTD